MNRVFICTCLFFITLLCNGCATSTSPYENRPVEELTEVYDPRTDGKYADFSGWGATYVIHKMRLDMCGIGNRPGGEFEDHFFKIIKEMSQDKKQLNAIRKQVLRGVRNVEQLSRNPNYIDLLIAQSKQVCTNPEYFSNQIISKMSWYGSDWRDNYSQQ